jgi:rhamnose transport system permease protein
MTEQTAANASPRPAIAWRAVLGSWTSVVIIALVGVIVIGSLSIDNVATPRFWRFLILDIIPIALIALPMTLVVITGEIDLSVASTLGVSCVVFGQLYVAGVTSLPLLIAICLVLGAVLGAFNGLFITVFGLPSLAVTIGTLAFFRGLAYVVIGDKFVATYPTEWTRGAIGPIPRTLIPWMSLVVLAAAALFAVVLHATPIGRGLYAIGNNADGARFAGVAVARTKFWLFAVTGAVSALAGVFYTLRFASARNDIGSGLELSVVAAVLLGGVSIFGGRGGIVGVVAAVVLLGTLRNVLQLASVPPNAITIVIGGLLIASVVGPNVITMVRARRRRRPGATSAAPAASTP